MSYAAERLAIEQRFAAAWTQTPIAWDNVDFTPPAGAWVRLSILNGGSAQIGMGVQPVVRHAGTVVIQVFVPTGTGTGTARDYADQIVPIFRLAMFGDIVCGAVDMVPIEHGDGWFQFRLAVPYRRDEFVAV